MPLTHHNSKTKPFTLSRLTYLSLTPGMAGDGGGASQAPSTQVGSGAASASQLWGHLSLTLLQQGHLAPLPLLAQPVFWQHDGALGLYPLPDAVLLADASAAQGEFMHEGCRVINPVGARGRAGCVRVLARGRWRPTCWPGGGGVARHVHGQGTAVQLALAVCALAAARIELHDVLLRLR